MVRSNPEKKVGFLSDERRMNVAITRAKTFVAVICDSATVSSNPFLGNIVKYILQFGQSLHAKMYTLDPDFKFSVGAFAGQKKADSEELKSAAKQPKYKKKVIKPAAATTAPAVPAPKSADLPKDHSQPPAMVDAEEEKKLVAAAEKERAEAFAKLCKMVDDFVASSEQKVLELPETLTGYERLQIHQYVSDTYKELQHESTGEGVHRHIILQKPTPKPKEIESPETDIMKLLNPEQVKKVRAAEEEKRRKEVDAIKKRRAKERKAKAKAAKEGKKGEEEDEKDVEAELDKMIMKNKMCSMVDSKGTKCVNSIEVFGRMCPNCSKPFCLEHIGAAMHRCPKNTMAPQSRLVSDPAGLKAALNSKLNELKALRAHKVHKKK